MWGQVRGVFVRAQLEPLIAVLKSWQTAEPGTPAPPILLQVRERGSERERERAVLKSWQTAEPGTLLQVRERGSERERERALQFKARVLTGFIKSQPVALKLKPGRTNRQRHNRPFLLQAISVRGVRCNHLDVHGLMKAFCIFRDAPGSITIGRLSLVNVQVPAIVSVGLACAATSLRAPYSETKVANRDVRIWHLVIDNGY